ncbi:MAG: hypothetical protein KUG78_04575 [Kangiellaceae bacterium]|nr:hypothetical protein [Kangiellaceae bacterium]
MAGISIVQKREQQRARIRQEVAKYKYRANETANILSNFSAVPIGTESRSLMLKYILLNLNQASKLAPTDAMLRKNLLTIEEQSNNPASSVDSQKLKIPRDQQQLNHLIQQLSKLGKYLIKFKSIKAMDSTMISASVGKISALISEAKICAYIQQGRSALASHDYVRAQRFFQTAQQMLNKIANKNSRLISLEAELKELTSLKPSEAASKKLSIDAEVDNKEYHENGEKDSKDDIFGPKKKW